MFYNDLFFVLNGIFDGNDGQFSEIVLIFCHKMKNCGQNSKIMSKIMVIFDRTFLENL